MYHCVDEEGAFRDCTLYGFMSAMLQGTYCATN